MKTLNESSIGIDISKHLLDVVHLPSNTIKQYANNTQGIKALIKWIKGNTPDLIVFEPTGGYEKLLKSTLIKAKQPFSMVNAKLIRNYAKAKGLLAKSDKIDAKILAEYGIKMQPPLTSNTPCYIEPLREWLKRRNQIVDNLRIEQQRLDHNITQDITDLISQTINHLNEQLDIIDIKIRDIIAHSNELANQQQLLMQEKGIGAITSAILLAELPELGRVTHGQIASLVGVAPHCRDSGNFKGYRHVQGGRKIVRNALYMAVISAIKSNIKIKTFYQRLRNNGKKTKVAITACIRKFLVILNATLKLKYYNAITSH